MSIDLPYSSSHRDSDHSQSDWANDHRYPARDRYQRDYSYQSAGTVTAAKVVLGITTGFLALNLLVSLSHAGELPGLSLLIVLVLTVLLGVATGKTGNSRAWGLGGGSIGIALAGLMLLMTVLVNDLRISESVKSSLNASLGISALIYGGLGLTVVFLLNSRTAREYYSYR